MNEETLKYELTGITEESPWNTLYRIRALKDFGDVSKGDFGGWVENANNLSQEGNCWIYDEARVMEFACVEGNAQIRDYAHVFGLAIVRGNSFVSDYSTVKDSAFVDCYATICDYGKVGGDSVVSGDILVRDKVVIHGNAIVDGDVCIVGETHISLDGYITSNEDFFSIGNIGSRNDTITFYLTKDKEIMVNTGCFTGTIEEFYKAVQNTHKGNKHERSYNMAIILALHQLKGKTK